MLEGKSVGELEFGTFGCFVLSFRGDTCLEKAFVGEIMNYDYSPRG